MLKMSILKRSSPLSLWRHLQQQQQQQRRSFRSSLGHHTVRKGARTSSRTRHEKLTLTKSPQLTTTHHQSSGHIVSQTLPPLQTSQRPGLLATMMDGLSHGVGWAFGMRAVDALFGPRHMEVVQQNEMDQQKTIENGDTTTTSNDSLDQQVPDQSFQEQSFENNFGQNQYGQEGWTWGNDDTDDTNGFDDFDFDV